MKRPLFTGLCTALVTPFLEGKVNDPLLEVLIRRQLDAGAEAIVLAGTTGESPTLTQDEKLELFQVGVRAAGGRCRIIAGTGSNCTANAVELSVRAQELGVDGLLVVTPYYNKCTQPGLLKHYDAIAGAVSLPVIAYNVPSRTGVDISVESCKALSRIPNLAGIKEACGDISKAGRILAECDLPVYSGNDDQTIPMLSLGGIGVISVLSNIVPKVMHDICELYFKGDIKSARDLQIKYTGLMNAMFCDVNPIPVKEAINILGLDVGPCRMPLYPTSEANKQLIKQKLNECGFNF